MATIFKIQILRTYETEKGIIGECYVNDTLIAMTLELPWKDNQPQISSIPKGNYKAILRYDKSRDGFFTIQLQGTGPRTGIQIHVGNKPDDITGCILLGLKAKVNEMTVGESSNAIKKLKTIFYKSENPLVCPDIEIQVSIRSLPLPLRFYASQTDKSFSWVFENGFWMSQGGAAASKFKEILRDTKWIISRTENSGVLSGRYIRWGIMGNTAFEISKDLKNWTIISDDELLLRSPAMSSVIWSFLKNNGGSLKTLMNSKFIAFNTHYQIQNTGDPPTGDEPSDPRDEYNDDDPAHEQDGVIELDFTTDYGDGPYDGDVVSIDDPDYYDDYYDDRGYDDGYDSGYDGGD